MKCQTKKKGLKIPKTGHLAVFSFSLRKLHSYKRGHHKSSNSVARTSSSKAWLFSARTIWNSCISTKLAENQQTECEERFSFCRVNGTGYIFLQFSDYFIQF